MYSAILWAVCDSAFHNGLGKISISHGLKAAINKKFSMYAIVEGCGMK